MPLHGDLLETVVDFEPVELTLQPSLVELEGELRPAGHDHPLARWMPQGLPRLLAMRALLIGRSADDPLRHAAEVGAWSTFEPGGRRRKRRMSMLLVHERSGAYRWVDPSRDEDDSVSDWHDAGATVWRFDLESIPSDPEDDERRPAALGVVIAPPVLEERSPGN